MQDQGITLKKKIFQNTMLHFITRKNVINCAPVLFHVTHQKLSFVGNSRNEEFKGSVPTMEPLIDLPMLDILLFTMFVKISLQTIVLCESTTGKLKYIAINVSFGSSDDCLGYPGKI